MRLSPQALFANLGSIYTGLQQGRQAGEALRLQREEQQSALDLRRQGLALQRQEFEHGLQREGVLDERFRQGQELGIAGQMFGDYADPRIYGQALQRIASGGHLTDPATVVKAGAPPGAMGAGIPNLSVSSGTYADQLAAGAGETKDQQRYREQQRLAGIQGEERRQLEGVKSANRLRVEELRRRQIAGDKLADRKMRLLIAGIQQGITSWATLDALQDEAAFNQELDRVEMSLGGGGGGTPAAPSQYSAPVAGEEVAGGTPPRTAAPAMRPGDLGPTKASAGAAYTQAKTGDVAANAEDRRKNAESAALRAEADVARNLETKRYHNLQERWREADRKSREKLAGNRLSFDQRKEAFSQQLRSAEYTLKQAKEGSSDLFTPETKAYAGKLLEQMNQLTLGMRQLQVRSATGELSKEQKAAAATTLQEFQQKYDAIYEAWKKTVQGENPDLAAGMTKAKSETAAAPGPTVTAGSAAPADSRGMVSAIRRQYPTIQALKAALQADPRTAAQASTLAQKYWYGK